MNILIVGCGDTGSQLANVLDHSRAQPLLEGDGLDPAKIVHRFDLAQDRYVYGGSSH